MSAVAGKLNKRAISACYKFIEVMRVLESVAFSKCASSFPRNGNQPANGNGMRLESSRSGEANQPVS